MATDDSSARLQAAMQNDCRVLLIDDDPVVAEALRMMLEGEDDLSMQYCQDASTTLEIAERMKPTVILLDMVMPEIDGLTLLNYLRGHEAIRSVPIVALSMKDDAKLKAEFFSAGGNDYIIKLPESIELLARIRYHSKAYIRLLQRDEAFRALDISQRELAASNIKLQRQASVDGLTGIPNRRTFEESITAEWERAVRDCRPLSLIMMDIDCFKRCNDHYGHQHGDEVLRRVARTLNTCLQRPTDTIARYGGEEFAVLLPGTDLEGAAQVAEKLRQAVDALKLENAKSEVCDWVTISLGAASCQPGSGDSESELLIKQADDALYEAKKQGRNRVVRPACTSTLNGALPSCRRLQ